MAAPSMVSSAKSSKSVRAIALCCCLIFSISKLACMSKRRCCGWRETLINDERRSVLWSLSGLLRRRVGQSICRDRNRRFGFGYRLCSGLDCLLVSPSSDQRRTRHRCWKMWWFGCLDRSIPRASIASTPSCEKGGIFLATAFSAISAFAPSPPHFGKAHVSCPLVWPSRAPS